MCVKLYNLRFLPKKILPDAYCIFKAIFVSKLPIFTESKIALLEKKLQKLTDSVDLQKTSPKPASVKPCLGKELYPKALHQNLHLNM